jgi:hypothetical protein
MADTGSVAVWALGKRVNGTWARRPKGGRVPKDGAVMFVGFDSPISHFAELGTVKERARPFLTPAVDRGVSGAGPYIKAALAKRAAKGHR